MRLLWYSLFLPQTLHHQLQVGRLNFPRRTRATAIMAFSLRSSRSCSTKVSSSSKATSASVLRPFRVEDAYRLQNRLRRRLLIEVFQLVTIVPETRNQPFESLKLSDVARLQGDQDMDRNFWCVDDFRK